MDEAEKPLTADARLRMFVEALDIGEDIAEQAMDDIDTLAAARAAAPADGLDPERLARALDARFPQRWNADTVASIAAALAAEYARLADEAAE